jgi:hypothetical protein
MDGPIQRGRLRIKSLKHRLQPNIIRALWNRKSIYIHWVSHWGMGLEAGTSGARLSQEILAAQETATGNTRGARTHEREIFTERPRGKASHS